MRRTIWTFFVCPNQTSRLLRCVFNWRITWGWPCVLGKPNEITVIETEEIVSIHAFLKYSPLTAGTTFKRELAYTSVRRPHEVTGRGGWMSRYYCWHCICVNACLIDYNRRPFSYSVGLCCSELLSPTSPTWLFLWGFSLFMWWPKGLWSRARPSSDTVEQLTISIPLPFSPVWSQTQLVWHLLHFLTYIILLIVKY